MTSEITKDTRVSEEAVETEVNNSDIEKKKKKKPGFFGRNWSWLSAMAITAVFMVAIMIKMDVAPFGTGSFTLVDSIHQYIPFFSEYQNKLLNGESLAYTWDIGLGQNFQSLVLYYMASPLNLIMVFFARENLIAMFSSLVALKIVISSGCFGYFLSRRDEKIQNNVLILAFSVGYSINNYMCGYYWNIMWLDCIMVFPLIILGYERLMKNRDPRLYTLALFYSMYCNYYISFIICIFLVLWFFATGHKNPKKFIIDGLSFGGCSLLSAGMAAVSLLMAYLAIMKTASAGSSFPEWSRYQNYFELLKKQFFLTKPIAMDSFDGNANLYAGTLTIIAFFLYIFSDKIGIAEKIRKVLLIVLMIVSMNQEYLNFIWHGFHNQYGIPNRFSFLYIFVLLLMGYEVISVIRETNIFLIAAGILASCAFLGVVYMNTDLEGIVSDKYMMMISYGVIVLYAIVLLIRKVGSVPLKLTNAFLALYMVVELCINGWLGMVDHGPCDGEYYMQYSKSMQELVGEVEQMAEDRGHKFYRQEIVDPIMLDENTYNNMKSIGTFCSTVRGDMVDTMAYMGFYTGANEYLFKGDTLMTNDLFGVRYIYVRPGDYYPASNDYKLVKEGTDTDVYENECALPPVFGVKDSLSTDWDFETYNSANVLNQFAEYAAGVDEIFEETHPLYAVTGDNCMADYNTNSPDIISYEGGAGDYITIHATAIIRDKGRYYLNCRANYLDEITYTVNGEEKASGRYETQLMDLGELDEGDEIKLDMEFSSSYSPSGTISMYMSTLNKDRLTQLRAILMKNKMRVTKVTDDELQGNIRLKEDQIIFTSIPYDEGWQIYLDGNRVDEDDIDIIGGGFLGIWADEGQHTLRMKFVPQGRKLGILISIVCWIIYLLIVVIWWRVNKVAARKTLESEEEDDLVDNPVDDAEEKK